MNSSGSVALLHKLITLQNLYSSFLSNNAQALKEGKPLPEQLSINLFKLIYLINSNSLINKQFDILNIHQSFQKMNAAAAANNNNYPYVPALSITDIIKIIIEVLGKDSIIIPQQSSSNKDKQLLRLSPQISLEFIKQNLGEIFVAYKKETLEQVERYENDFKMTLKEIQLIEGGKIDDKVLEEEYFKNQKLKEMQQAAKLKASQQAETAQKPNVPASAQQTPAARKVLPASTPQTAPPALSKKASQAALSLATPTQQQQQGAKMVAPATQVKPPSSASPTLAAHRPLTRGLEKKIEVSETPIAKQKELMKEKSKSKDVSDEEEKEKQKIAEEIEDSLIASEKEEEGQASLAPVPAVAESILTSSNSVSQEETELLAESESVTKQNDKQSSSEVEDASKPQSAESYSNTGDNKEGEELNAGATSDRDEAKPSKKDQKDATTASPDPATPQRTSARLRKSSRVEDKNPEDLKESEITNSARAKVKQEDVEDEVSVDQSGNDDKDEEHGEDEVAAAAVDTEAKPEESDHEEQEQQGESDANEEKETKSEEEEEDKPKTRASARLQHKSQEDISLPMSTRKRKRSEPFVETPSKMPNANKKFQTVALQLVTQLSTHRFASTFLQPVNKNDEPDYYNLIKEPQDLKTITREIKHGTITEFSHLQRNLMLMFCNALMYNETGSDISNLTLEMMHECEELIETFKDYF